MKQIVVFRPGNKWDLVEPALKSGAIKFKDIPREYTGLRKDGKRDMRFKKGNTMAELQEYLDDISGIVL